MSTPSATVMEELRRLARVHTPEVVLDTALAFVSEMARHGLQARIEAKHAPEVECPRCRAADASLASTMAVLARAATGDPFGIGPSTRGEG